MKEGIALHEAKCGLFLRAVNPFNAGIKSLRATLPDEMFYWEFCFLNGAFR
jgi:hypothetical protein